MKDRKFLRVGIDAGSTTVKVLVLNESSDIVYKSYRRHKTDINSVLIDELSEIGGIFEGSQFLFKVTGSAGMGLSERASIEFVQEVLSSVRVIKQSFPETKIMIDLGGEDAKMVFFSSDGAPDIRMNGSCSGGTGSFIDQMADLMAIGPQELGEAALNYHRTYPVASRCGVFAKTDVQNLLSRGVRREDLARSILDAVSLQSITTLARGSLIESPIICIGGPFRFIPALRDSFRDALSLEDGDISVPDNSEYFPAWGAALAAQAGDERDMGEIVEKLRYQEVTLSSSLAPLFRDEKHYNEWLANRNIRRIKTRELSPGERVRCFLGVDSGSTTTKIVLLDEDNSLIYNYYEANRGNSLERVKEGLERFFDDMDSKGVKVEIVASASTGYGEELIKSAFDLNWGIVETVAHLNGAQFVDPSVSFILDIGGQDIKSIFVKEGVISNIELNEACSSGCGSFLQNFASTIGLDPGQFATEAVKSDYPSDLGSRCSVFMNSRVKQSLREGATVGDISAGLAYSVVKNCLFKVLKISNLNKLGENIVVQGGTFRNDAVYRALEILSGKRVSSTEYPELMGAFGAALYAGKRWASESQVVPVVRRESLIELSEIERKEINCSGCNNRCSINKFSFKNGNLSYSGNRCEKIFSSSGRKEKRGYNAFDHKNRVIFERKEYDHGEKALRVGIPRGLNMFENYPFWYTLLSESGIEVVLSPESTTSLYRKGVSGVMSDNICFPAKLMHGHVLSLIEIGVDRIFYPMVVKDVKEYPHTVNSFNCPVVSGYPDVIRSSHDTNDRYGIPLDKPVVTFSNIKHLRRVCTNYLLSLGVDKAQADKSFDRALECMKEVCRELIDNERERFDEAVAKGGFVFVMAGRPYHADPLINQKAGQILSDLGVDLFTDDIFRRDISQVYKGLNVVSQWAYPNRVLQAADRVAKLPQNVQLVQLNSFGCGPDSFFMDDVANILNNSEKNHTVLRIDEIASPGSIRLRLRSLLESIITLDVKDGNSVEYDGSYLPYKGEDRRKTIIAPWFSDFISPFIPVFGELAGYKIVNLPPSSKATADLGLKYGNNEVCYPSTLVLGDIVAALQSGSYDLDNTVVAITQTGGQCRATNYLAQIRSGIRSAGFEQVPVIALSLSGKVFQNDQKAFRIPIVKLANIAIYAILFADSLQQMYSSVVVREFRKGESQRVFDQYVGKAVEIIRERDCEGLLELLKEAVEDFNAIEVVERDYERVGLVGEIYVKYNRYGQAYITEWVQSKGIEVVTPPFLDFVMQYFVNSRVNMENGVRRGSLAKNWLSPAFLRYMNNKIAQTDSIMKEFRYYHPSPSIFTKAGYAEEILDLSNQFGEGWSVAAEVAYYARNGVDKVVCVQPFACIANHIVAKGIEKRVKKLYPSMSMLFLDIDGGIAEVNLQNRLHFLIES